MQSNFNRAVFGACLLGALLGASQLASFASLLNLLDDESESVSPNAQGQSFNTDGHTSTIKDNTKLDVNGIRSTLSELLHDEFAQEGVDRRLVNARKNINKGEKMMQSCGDDHNKAEYKKGKVMKEIGEKNLAALKAGSQSSSESSSELDRTAKTKEIPDSL